MKEFAPKKYFEQGDTNEVFLTEKDTVVKKFSRFSAPAVTISLACTFSGYPRFFTRNNRMESERKIREKDLEGLKFPEILSSGKEFMEFEYIEGQSLKEKALNGEAEEVGRQLGEVMESLQRKDIFLTDYFLDNFVVTGQGLYHIDPEYAGFTYSPTNSLMDLLSIILTLKLLPRENCLKALKGFRDVHGEVSLVQMFLANFLTLLYASVLGSREEFFNAVRNFKL